MEQDNKSCQLILTAVLVYQKQQLPALSYHRIIKKYSFGLFKQIESVCVCIFMVNSLNISIYDIILDVLAGFTEKYFINICCGPMYVALTV